MAGNTAKLVVQIVTDASKAHDGIDKATESYSGFEKTMKGLVGPALAVSAAVVGVGAAAINSASEFQQSMGGIEAVFGSAADGIKKKAGEAANSVGLSAAQYGNFATVVGAQLKNLGVPFDQVAGHTDDLIKLGADLAATYGGTTADAVSALSAALRGEADPAERYGLALNVTAVNAKLAEKGLTGLEGQALTAAKAQTILEMATQQAGGAVGQFGREADTLSGQQQRLTAQWENATAELGQSLLPAATAVVGVLAEFGGWVQQNIAIVGPLIAVIGALAATVLIVNAAMSAWAAIQAIVKVVTLATTAAQWALNTAFAANPVGIIIIAIIALIAVFVLLWNNNKAFRDFFINLWKQITQFFSNAWKSAVDIVTGLWDNMLKVGDSIFKALLKPINWVVDAFNNIVNAVKSVIDWIGKIKIPNIAGLSIGGKAAQVSGFAAPMALQAAPYTTGGVRVPSGGRSAVVERSVTNITVEGGLDSADAIARRIRQLLDSRDRRTGGVVLTRVATP